MGRGGAARCENPDSVFLFHGMHPWVGGGTHDGVTTRCGWAIALVPPGHRDQVSSADACDVALTI